MTPAEEIIDDLVKHPSGCENDGRANRLLKQYYHGETIESLRTLMQSDDEALNGEAAWIGSELPAAGHGLLTDAARLLRSKGRKARFFAIDCVQLWSVPPQDGGPLSEAVARVNDDDRAVRWKALCFLATASTEQLLAAITFLTDTNPDSEYVTYLKWLLSDQPTTADIVNRIRSSDPLERRFGAVAASRLVRLNESPLKTAAQALDDEIAKFANDMLQRLSGAATE